MICERLVADTMPVATDCSRPNGLPMDMTHSPIIGVPDLDGGQAAGIAQLDDGDVAGLVGAHHVGVVLLAAHGDLQGVGTRDHMVVRDDVAILGEHHAAAQRAFGERSGA